MTNEEITKRAEETYKGLYEQKALISGYIAGATMLQSEHEKDLAALKEKYVEVVGMLRESILALEAVDVFEIRHEPIIGTRIINKVRSTIRKAQTAISNLKQQSSVEDKGKDYLIVQIKDKSGELFRWVEGLKSYWNGVGTIDCDYEPRNHTIWKVRRLSDNLEIEIGGKAKHKDSDKNIITITKFFIAPNTKMIVQGKVDGSDGELAWYLELIEKVTPESNLRDSKEPLNYQKYHTGQILIFEGYRRKIIHTCHNGKYILLSQSDNYDITLPHIFEDTEIDKSGWTTELITEGAAQEYIDSKQSAPIQLLKTAEEIWKECPKSDSVSLMSKWDVIEAMKLYHDQFKQSAPATPDIRKALEMLVETFKDVEIDVWKMPIGKVEKFKKAYEDAKQALAAIPDNSKNK